MRKLLVLLTIIVFTAVLGLVGFSCDSNRCPDSNVDNCAVIVNEDCETGGGTIDNEQRAGLHNQESTFYFIIAIAGVAIVAATALVVVSIRKSEKRKKKNQ